MADWMPIETAPKDVAVLVWSPGSRDGAQGAFGSYNDPGVCVAICVDSNSILRDMGREAKWEWCGDVVEFERGWESTGSYCCSVLLNPTHWQPLPPPPTEDR